MQVLDAVIALLAVLSLGVYYTRRGLCPALAPLAAVCTAVLFLAVCGVCGLLLPGAFVFTALALAFGVFTVIKTGLRQALAAVWHSTGFMFFVLAGVGALLWLGLRQPVFGQWDEYSFWGTAVKLMKLNGELYTTAPVGWFWTSTEMPALPLLGWFVQFLGGAFAPWKVYFGYSLLLFACFAALAAPFEKKKVVALPLLVVGLALPFFFQSPERVARLSPAYLSAYGDLPAGVLFGGALVFYGALRMTKKNALWALLPLGALALVKDNTFPLALVAGGLMLADTLLFCPAGPTKAEKGKKAGLLAAFLAAPLGAYIFWKQHAAWANAQNPATGGVATGASPFGAAGDSLAQLMGLHPQSKAFSGAKEGILNAFVDPAYTPVSMLGSGLCTLLLVLFLLALAVLLAPGRRAKLRVVLWAGLSAGGFLGFQFMLLTYFAFLSKSGSGLPDYVRYSATYYLGWLMLALFLLAGCVLEKQTTTQLHGRTARGLTAQSLVLCLAGGFIFLTARIVLPGYSVLDYTGTMYDLQKQEEAAAMALAGQLPAGSRVFYLNPEDDGGGWFRTHYYLQPNILDYSFGGNLAAPRMANGEISSTPLTMGQLREYLAESGCDYIYVDGMNAETAQRFGPLFVGGLKDIAKDQTLYKKTEKGLYAPV